MHVKYTLSIRDGYVVLQLERMQRGYEAVADYGGYRDQPAL
jgi:hypothetical protein